MLEPLLLITRMQFARRQHSLARRSEDAKHLVATHLDQPPIPALQHIARDVGEARTQLRGGVIAKALRKGGVTTDISDEEGVNRRREGGRRRRRILRPVSACIIGDCRSAASRNVSRSSLSRPSASAIALATFSGGAGRFPASMSRRALGAMFTAVASSSTLIPRSVRCWYSKSPKRGMGILAKRSPKLKPASALVSSRWSCVQDSA